jgi:hypothetical protein
MYMGGDFFRNRDDNTAPEKHEGLDDFRRQRSLHKAVIAVLLLAVVGAAWRFTGGNVAMTALLTGAAAASGASLSLRLRGMKSSSGSLSAGRIVLNIAVAVVILMAVWYFYVRGISYMPEP